jgi:photosystem II stability/assembly factor-like uncharacterized protein
MKVREETMRRNGIQFSRSCLSIAFGFAALGLVTCSILSPKTATLPLDSPASFPTPQIQNTKTKLPAFTRTLFPALTNTATPTGTPYPKNEWISLGPEGGEVMDIVVDPMTPSTLYAVTWSAGIFKSINGGQEWRNINTDRISINQLLIDRFSPSTLYILSNKGGIYKTINAGDTWKEIYPDHTSNPAKPEMILLAIDPSRQDTLYAKNDEQQILRSTNGGNSWIVVGNVTEILGDFIIGVDVFLEVIPQNPTSLFLGTWEGLYRSNDGGVHWMKTNSDEAVFLLADPTSPDILYLGKGDGALFTSPDGGAEWELLQNSDFNVHDLAIDPENPSIIYAATGDPSFSFMANYKPDMAIRVSLDKGKHWDVVFQPGDISINRIASDPKTSGHLYTGTNLGIFHSIDGGKRWNVRNTRLTAQQIGVMVIDPTAPCRFYRSAGALMKSEDCGVHWKTIDAKMPDNLSPSGYLLLDYKNPFILYLITQRKIIKSMDSGENWKEIMSSIEDAIIFVDMDPRDPNILYTIEMGGTAHMSIIRKSGDGGESWEEIASPTDTVWSLTLAPTIPTTIYALTATGIYKSEDRGYQWAAFDAGVPALDMGHLIADPIRPETLYLVSTRNKIYISIDGGGSWSEIHTNLPNMIYLELAIDPVNPSTMYAFTYEDGIFQSRDGGWNWIPFSTGLKTKKINTMMFDPQDHLILYAGTGGGLYTMHLSG